MPLAPSPHTERRVIRGLAIAALASVALAALLNPGLVRFRPFTLLEFVELTMPLVFVALFIERAIEVFITSWRAETKRKLTDPLHYAARTERITFIAGTAIGVVLASLGLRMLGLFVDPEAFRTLPIMQQKLFTTADVLLTGAVLGGGADALHKLVSVFTNFMDSSAKWARQRAPKDETVA